MLIVDDSAVMRSLLRAVLGADPGVEVVGTAADGESALQAVLRLSPDLILLDVEMPVMDGLVTLRELRRRRHALPVIMCSALTQRGARVTLEALAAGASDYVAKPAGQAHRDAAMRTLGQELLPKIHALVSTGAAAGAPPASGLRAILPPHRSDVPGIRAMGGGAAGIPLQAQGSIVNTGPCIARPSFERGPAPAARPSVLAIGVSTGGPAALGEVLPALPADFPLPVLIVQHMPEMFTRLFAEQLAERCKLRVREAVEGMPVLPGGITIARGNWHLEVRGQAGSGLAGSGLAGSGLARSSLARSSLAGTSLARSGVSRSNPAASLHLTQAPLENHCRPAVDVLFRSVAAVYGAGALAAVMTGMGSDGMHGAAAIRRQGGTVLVQDQASSIVWGMPGAVAQAGLANQVVQLHKLAAVILGLAGGTYGESRELREAVVQP